MSRTCQCGGIIRQAGVAFWDILPSCTCTNPVAIQPTTTIYTTTTTTTQSDSKDKQ